MTNRLLIAIPIALALACGACAKYPIDPCPGESTGVIFRVVNDHQVPVFVTERALGFPFDLQAQQGTEWELFLPGLGCQTDCDGCSNACFDTCTPVFLEWCAPVVHMLEVVSSRDYRWDGRRTESPYDEFPTCHCEDTDGPVNCLHEWQAVAGHYRVELCSGLAFTPVEDGCGGEHFRGNLDNPTCQDVEFDYDRCTFQTVEIHFP